MEVQEVQYSEITVLTHFEALEGLADALLEIGAKGVAEERHPLHIRVTAYLLSDDQLDEKVAAVRKRLSALEKEGLRIGPGTVNVRPVAAQAWGEIWREHFDVEHIAPGLVIAPVWEHYQPQSGEAVVTLDPGAAFGTGGHATTRLCLRALVEQIRPGDMVADVGCGSGILAIAAAMLGARRVLAIDNDPVAIAVARQNINRNGVGDRVQVTDGDLLSASETPFDLVISNITSAEVIRLVSGLRARLSHGGRFICSGFQGTAVPAVENALPAEGLRMIAITSEEGWAACVAMRPPMGR